MKLMAVNVGRPRAVVWRGRSITTGIFKDSVEGPVAVGRANLAGDGQADLEHHGGSDKAVYLYPHDHYAWWSRTLERDDLVAGIFGENLTVEGIDESVICIGDRLQIGSARFTVTQPRVPCFKLGLRFGDDAMPKRFTEAGRPGIYLRVDQEGVVQAGDTVTSTASGIGGCTVQSVFQAWFRPGDLKARQTLAAALDEPALSDDWRRQITARLQSDRSGRTRR